MRFDRFNDDDPFDDPPEYDEEEIVKAIESALGVNTKEAKEFMEHNERIMQYLVSKLDKALLYYNNIQSLEAIKICSTLRDSFLLYQKNPMIDYVLRNVDDSILMQDVDVDLIPDEIRQLVCFLRDNLFFKEKLNKHICDLLYITGGFAKEILLDILNMLNSDDFDDACRVELLETGARINQNSLNENAMNTFVFSFRFGDINERFSPAGIASECLSDMVFTNPIGLQFLFNKLRNSNINTEALVSALSDITADLKKETASIPNFFKIAEEGILICSDLLINDKLPYSFAFDVIDIINNLLEFCLLNSDKKKLLVNHLSKFVQRGYKHALYPIQKLTPENQSILPELCKFYTSMMSIEYYREEMKNVKFFTDYDLDEDSDMQEIQQISNIELISMLLETISMLGISMQNLCPYVLEGIVSKEKELRSTALDIFKKFGSELNMAVNSLSEIYNQEQGFSEEVRDAAFKALKAVTALPKQKS